MSRRAGGGAATAEQLCPLCDRVIRVGELIAKVRRGWAHRACPAGRSTVSTDHVGVTTHSPVRHSPGRPDPGPLMGIGGGVPR